MVSTRWLLVDPRQREFRRSLSEDRRKPPTRIQNPWDLCVQGPNCVLYFLRIAILETYVNHEFGITWHDITTRWSSDSELFGSWRLSRIRYLIGPNEFDGIPESLTKVNSKHSWRVLLSQQSHTVRSDSPSNPGHESWKIESVKDCFAWTNANHGLLWLKWLNNWFNMDILLTEARVWEEQSVQTTTFRIIELPHHA